MHISSSERDAARAEVARLREELAAARRGEAGVQAEVVLLRGALAESRAMAETAAIAQSGLQGQVGPSDGTSP